MKARSILGFGLLGLLGCGSGARTVGLPNDGETNPPVAIADTGVVIAPPIENGVAVAKASAEECAYGGVVIQSYADVQGDGRYDAGDTLLSSTPVCAGAPGASARNTGIKVTGAGGQCPAGGLLVTTFFDDNGNGARDAEETITSMNAVCDGINGKGFSLTQTAATPAQCPAGGVVYSVTEIDALGNLLSGSTTESIVCAGTAGAAGTDGKDGIGMVFATVPATAEQCPAGGTVVVLALDSAGTGVYADTDQQQASVTLCNGTSAPLSPLTLMASIATCGAASSPWKEVVFCLADGSILASFSADLSGTKTRFAFLTAGTYQNTDSSGCPFSVTTAADGAHTVSWNAGHNQYATWDAGSYACIVH